MWEEKERCPSQLPLYPFPFLDTTSLPVSSLLGPPRFSSAPAHQLFLFNCAVSDIREMGEGSKRDRGERLEGCDREFGLAAADSD